MVLHTTYEKFLCFLFPNKTKIKNNKGKEKENSTYKSSETNVKFLSATTIQRRGAICIIVNDPDDEDEYEALNRSHLTSCSSCSDGIESDQEYDEAKKEYMQNECHEKYKINSDANINITEFDSTLITTKNSIKNLKRSTTRRKTRKILKNQISSTDAQVHPVKLNFWHKIILKTKKKRHTRHSTMKKSSCKKKRHKSCRKSNRNTNKFIDYFRRSSRDIRRKSGEG